MSIFIATIIFILSSENSMAEIYKCKDKTGLLVFSDKKCSDKPEIVKIKKYKKSQPPASSPFICLSGITAVANNLHYPTLNNLDEAIRLAETNLTSLRYRKLIKRVDPADILPDRVSKVKAEAFHAADVPGFSNGVVVNIKICK